MFQGGIVETLAVMLAVSFVGLAALHLYWAFRGTFGMSAALRLRCYRARSLEITHSGGITNEIDIFMLTEAGMPISYCCT